MRGFWTEQGGQAVVIVATMMTTLIMFVGLAVDAGTLYSARRTMQEAADAAAYAGAVVLYQNSRALVPLTEDEAEDLARAAAANDATLNGFTHNVNGVAVRISLPPVVSQRFAGNDLYVEVTITRAVGTALLPSQFTTVSVRAVAGSEPLNNSYAIMSLNRGPTTCAFNTTAQADIHLSGGGILVNSSSATAACNLQNDASRFTIAPATEGVDINGNSNSAWPATLLVNTDEPQQADPLAGFPPPSTSCTPNVTPCTPMTVHNAIPANDVVDPGVWTVEMGGAGNTVVYMNPGIYVLKAGINASGNADLVSTSLTTTPACAVNCGVFIFNTHPNYPNAYLGDSDPAKKCGPLNLTGNATTDLKAQTTGEYANFLIYQDPACTNTMRIAGNGSFTGTGSIYLPNAAFVFAGTNASLVGSQLIANTVDLQDGNITIDFTAGTSAQPILPRLAE